MRSLFALAAALWLASAAAPRAQAPATPETKAVGYLLKEVPTWRAEKGCASCHHTGDAARALFMAAHRGHDVSDALKDVRALLEAPAGWTANKGHGDDEVLMRLQFASALAAAGEKDLNPSPALVEAAKAILADQMPDGSWVPDASDPPHTPLTWGTAVATWMARTTLIASGREPDDFAVAQADRWLRTAEASTVSDAAGIVLGLGVTSDVMADKQRATLLNMLRFAQREGGGWGATPGAESATVYDTALVLVALQELETDPRLARSTYRVEELRDAIAKGRAYLVAQQRPDGSWPATVRGSAAESAAQRLSTTAWALMALLRGSK
ncbi:MAG: prenyltransferase/squalene oxidase repeat-containing protein [Vicinamibacterales bacterium]